MAETDKDLRILSEQEIIERLKDFPGWNYKDNKISKEFKFDSFMRGVNLIVKLASFCDAIDHHPDIHIFYRKILFELQRFSVGGKVTERDFIVAKKIEELYKQDKI
jgi:4a-hydroxytetrahydrobiopterin dehydratase